MALKIIAAPALGDVAQGVAGLFGGGLQAQGFSPDSKLLLVRGVYSDSAYPLLASRTAFWVYDIKLDQYSACVNKLITSDRPIEVSDVAIATFNGQTQLIASYRDTGATALNLNKLALIRNGVLVNSDLVSLVSGNQADAMVDAIRVSANGRFVAIETAASNLTAELDTNGLKDIFLFDLVLNTSRRITTINGAESGFDSLLGDILVGTDGSLSVAFESAQVFTTQDSNGSNDVFVWRLLESEFAVAGAGTISLGSRSVSGAAGGNSPQLNSKGLVFNSESGAFSNTDLNNVNDVWQSTGSAVELVSLGSSGTLSGPSSLASSSDSGRVVAVVTASPEIAGQTGVEQLAIVNTVTRSTVIVSKSVSGALADDAVITPILSGDGTWVAFSSLAGNLGAGQADGEMHLYIVDLNNKSAVTLGGVATQGQTLIASVSDADGTTGLITYQWTAGSTVVSRVTTATLLLTQAEVGKTIGVIASYLDDNGRLETAISGFTSSVVNVNDAPTGSVTISGTPTQGQTLTAANTLADLDGIPASGAAGALSYQWKAGDVSISGATSSTYVLTQAEVGKTVTVTASYTDAFSTAESKTSSATTAVANVNDAPTGSVTISGTPTQGQTLTATNTLADVDGLGTISYQWKAGDVSISGATSSTYVLTQAEVGKTVTVTASYTDAFSTAESKTSSATTAVANVNDAPTGSVTISGTPTQGQTLTAANTLADLDGIPASGAAGALSYQWKAGDVSISGATSSTYVLTQAEVGKTVTVTASYTDAFSTAESKTSSATTAVANVNDAPTGSVTISGTPTQGQTLTATNTLADVDGLGTISYQWKAGDVSISGATSSTYVLTQAEVGKTVTVTASYTDAFSTAESKTSSATTAVANVNDAPTGSVTISGTPTQGQTLTAANTLADLDGIPASGAAGALSYQWKAGDVSISGATSSTYVLTQAEVGKTVTVTASYTDALSTAESKTSSATEAVANVNDAPSGSVTISGTATNGGILSIANTLADIDGLGTMGYQWQSSVNGSTDWRVIEDAINNTINLGPGSLGKHVRAVATYTDGQGTVETAVSQAVLETTNVVLQAYSWKAHTLLSGVSLSAAGTTHSGTSDSNGTASFTAITESSLTLTASRAIPSAEATATSAAVNLQDAIAILKMIVGLEVNGTGKALSPYQALAADYDGNGLVQLTDAIGVLKHVVGLTAPDPTWRFVNELDATVPSKTNLSPGVAQTSITASLSASSPVKVGLVGYLTGDVDGSFAGATSSSSLTKTYFDALVDAHRTELSLAQFGVY